MTLPDKVESTAPSSETKDRCKVQSLSDRLTPLLIASTEATSALFAEEPVLRWDWLAFLIAFDIIFLTAVWLFGEYLLEE